MNKPSLDEQISNIDAEIEALQEKRRVLVSKAEAAAQKAAKEEENILVPGTPTKSKSLGRPTALASGTSKPPALRYSLPAKKAKEEPEPPAGVPRSSLNERLAAKRKIEALAEMPPISERSKSAGSDDDGLEIVRDGTERASDLTVMNELKMGAREVGKDPEGGHVWRHLEPNSGIRLKKRVMAHSDLEDLLYGRYYLRPSQLYSLGRLSKDKQTYDVPVEGDWVTIAAVAERSEVRISNAKTFSDDEIEEEEGKVKREKKSRAPKKYISIKLVALPPRNKANRITGDAYLQLLLFESESIVFDGDDRSYRGGSGGAFEKWCNLLTVGSVVAILNPRIMRPPRAGATPHPLSSPLSLNPWSDSAISYIGEASDIGTCEAIRRDGTRCTAWVDKRIGVACEFHIQMAVKSKRSGRGDLASSTSSFATGPVDQNGWPPHPHDPRKKKGLLPASGAHAAPRGRDNGGGGTVYSSGANAARMEFAMSSGSLVDRMGRNQSEKRKRKAHTDMIEADLLEMGERSVGDGTAGGKLLKALRGEKDGPDPEKKSAFSPLTIQQIGFDPTGRRPDEDKSKKAESIALLTSGPRTVSSFPVKRMSNVVIPTAAAQPAPPPAATTPSDSDGSMVDLD